MTFAPNRRAVAMTARIALALALGATAARAALPKVPEGFEARLVANVPAVLYPCQVGTAPDGSLFVAEDPMDQVGPYEAFDGRILRFQDGKGEPTVWAEGFRAIQGMAWRDGALYVCHMPFLTVVKDTDGDGKADSKDDLFKDLGQTDNRGLNDHIVSGIQFGMDGYLYISVGDKGVPGATRPEDGDKVQLKGGGVLRCRPDGTGLEVYSSGTRNHLEANLNPRDDVFTYDNTDDGDGWWTRVTHHIDGGYYGYPYDYHDRPDRFLPRMAEYGGGSPCGAVIYKEDAWPEKYRGVGLWAEWGKGKVHGFRFEPKGASYEVAEAIDFALPDGLNNFRPIDLAVSYDGKTLYIADWSMGGWGSKDEKVGRVFAITYTGDDAPATRPRGNDDDPTADQLRQLDHPSFNERLRAQNALIKKGRDVLPEVVKALKDVQTPPLARRHLVWVVDGIAGGTPEATLPLIEALKDPEADVRAQAARALGERRAPIAVEPLSPLLRDADPVVRLQTAIALGRIGHAEAVPALLPLLADEDVYIAFAARAALRRIGDWEAAAEGLRSEDPKIRLGVLRALEQQYNPEAAGKLIEYSLRPDHPAAERAQALAFAAVVHRKAKPWDGKWWGTRPTQGKPPAKVDEWEGTRLVLETVHRGLRDPEVAVRLAAIAAVPTIDDPEALPILRERFQSEPDTDARRQVALALGKLKDKEALPALVDALRDGNIPEPVREAALTAVEGIGGDLAVKALIELLGRADLAAERQPRVIAALGQAKNAEAIPALVAKLASPDAPVRAAAAASLGQIGRVEGANTIGAAVRPLVDDPDAAVRKAAIGTLGLVKDREAVPALMAASAKEDTRYEAMTALASVSDVKALQIYLRGVADKNPDLRKASSAAIASVRDEAAAVLQQLADRRELPPSALPELRRVFHSVQPITTWRLLGPFPLDADPGIGPDSVDLNATHSGKGGKPITWRQVDRFVDKDGQVNLNRILRTNDRVFAFGYAEVQADAKRKAQMVVGSDDTLTVWLNGKQVYDAQGDRGFNPEQDRFDVELEPGPNRVLIQCANHGGGWMFAVGLTSGEEYAFLNAPAGGFDPDAYRDFALKQEGKPEHGRQLFADLKGLACVKCHAVGGEGGNVGPDLSGIGAQYPKEELIQSVLYPSQRIFSGYEPAVVATADGRVLTGIVKSDDADALEIQDAEAQRIRIPKSEVEERKISDVSLMPNGLAEGLSKEDFADLVAYLTTLRAAPVGNQGGPAGGK